MMLVLAAVLLGVVAVCADPSPPVSGTPVDQIPIDNIVATAKGNQLTVKLPAKPEISLVIFHTSLSGPVTPPSGGQLDSPILRTADVKDGFYQYSTSVSGSAGDLVGKTLHYWIRLEVTKGGNVEGYNSGSRQTTIGA